MATKSDPVSETISTGATLAAEVLSVAKPDSPHAQGYAQVLSQIADLSSQLSAQSETSAKPWYKSKTMIGAGLAAAATTIVPQLGLVTHASAGQVQMAVSTVGLIGALLAMVGRSTAKAPLK